MDDMTVRVDNSLDTVYISVRARRGRIGALSTYIT